MSTSQPVADDNPDRISNTSKPANDNIDNKLTAANNPVHSGQHLNNKQADFHLSNRPSKPPADATIEPGSNPHLDSAMQLRPADNNNVTANQQNPNLSSVGKQRPLVTNLLDDVADNSVWNPYFVHQRPPAKGGRIAPPSGEQDNQSDSVTSTTQNPILKSFMRLLYRTDNQTLAKEIPPTLSPWLFLQ